MVKYVNECKTTIPSHLQTHLTEIRFRGRDGTQRTALVNRIAENYVNEVVRIFTQPELWRTIGNHRKEKVIGVIKNAIGKEEMFQCLATLRSEGFQVPYTSALLDVPYDKKVVFSLKKNGVSYRFSFVRRESGIYIFSEEHEWWPIFCSHDVYRVAGKQPIELIIPARREIAALQKIGIEIYEYISRDRRSTEVCFVDERGAEYEARQEGDSWRMTIRTPQYAIKESDTPFKRRGAREEFFTLLDLSLRGLPFVRPIALVDEEHATFLITEITPHAMPFVKFVKTIDRDRREGLRRALRACVLTLVSNGIDYEDLYSNNMLVVHLPPKDPRIVIVDAETVTYTRPYSENTLSRMMSVLKDALIHYRVFSPEECISLSQEITTIVAQEKQKL